jgi:hypothetical protein
MTSTLRKNIWLGSLISIGSVVAIIFLYAVAHEGGHALAVILFGGEVTRFEVNFLRSSPSISYIGIVRPLQKAMVSLAGPIFPLLFMPFLVRLLPKTKNIILRSALLSLLSALLFTIVSSMIIAAAYGLGAQLSREDIVKFISYSGAHPFAVAGAFLLLLVLSAVLLVKVGRIMEVLHALGQDLRRIASPAKHVVRAKVFTILVVLVIGAIALSNAVSRTPSNSALSFQTKLSLDFFGPTQIYAFQVSEPTTYNFMYSLNTDSKVTLRLTNLDGIPLPFNNETSIVMYQGGEDVQQAYFTGFLLSEGNYAVEMITAGQGSIKMQIGTEEPGPAQLQYHALLERINAGTFTAESYHEPGYELIHHEQVKPGTDQLLVTLPGTKNQRQASVFIVGDYKEVEVVYVADGERRTLLNGFFRATIGYGLPAHQSIGEFRLTAVDPNAELYLFLHEDE